MAVLTAAAIFAIASVYPDWDANWVVWQALDAGTGNGESSGRTDVIDPSGKYVGLMQIDYRLHGYTIAEMQDPVKNIAAAHKLWLARGTQPWPSAVKYQGASHMIQPDLVKLSPNVNDAPMGQAKTVIIHCTRSGTSMNPTEFQGTLNYMSQAGTTSSHWVVGRDGRAARVVPDNRQAWHAQEDNDNAWGIEVEQGAEQDGFTEPQLSKLVAVCRGYMADYGVPAVHAATSTTPGFIGHQETAQGKRNGKSDPGKLFPWDAFIARLKGDGDMAEEHYDGELNARRAVVALMYNLTTTTQLRYSADGKAFEFINPADQTVIGKVPAVVVPDWAKPT